MEGRAPPSAQAAPRQLLAKLAALHFSSSNRAAENYFPMQNVLKIRFRMSSAVVAPVIPSSGRSAP